MSAAPDDATGPAAPDPPVGTLAEEALRLVAALGGDGVPGPGPSTGEHPAECTWCPVCRTLRALRVTDPEVRRHLAAAGASLLAAAAAVLAPPADVMGAGEPPGRPGPPEQPGGEPSR